MIEEYICTDIEPVISITPGGPTSVVALQPIHDNKINVLSLTSVAQPFLLRAYNVRDYMAMSVKGTFYVGILCAACDVMQQDWCYISSQTV